MKCLSFISLNGLFVLSSSLCFYFVYVLDCVSPCRNGGTCVPNYKYHTFDCGCKDGYVGDLCEIFGKFPIKGCQRTDLHFTIVIM